MPSKHTLTIKPIKEFVLRFAHPATGCWVDPFAGYHSIYGVTNDLDPDAPTIAHMDARKFLAGQLQIRGLFLDPPYSPRQISECYKSIGKTPGRADTQHAKLVGECKDIAAELMPPGAIAITCGWNSNGMGKARGFELHKILMVHHGAGHNDTIVTVEVKQNYAARARSE